MPNIPYISNMLYMRELHTILTIPAMPYILSYIHYTPPHHTHPTTPQGRDSTMADP